MNKLIPVIGLLLGLSVQSADASELSENIAKDYEQHLGQLWEHFHQNPELSYLETNTAARLAQELSSAGFEVTENVGGTGLVAMLENGAGPLVMMRADMDGLPLLEKSGLEHESKATWTADDGSLIPIMHACGHDVHITSLVGSARIMASSLDSWTGTLMLVVQPAEERAGGAKAMKADGIWDRFGLPDYALAFHVAAGMKTGMIDAVLGSPSSGSDSLDIIIHGVGTHGASAHEGIDPIVLGSQIVLALQTLVSRELAPRESGVITVGSFHAGSKHNIIPDRAHLQLTVRNDNFETRTLLLEGITRIAQNLGRAAGLPEDKLPEVILLEGTPPNMNHVGLTRRLRKSWSAELGDDVFNEQKRVGMFAEDFAYFISDPAIPSTYFAVGGSSPAEIESSRESGIPIAPHHSPLFKIEPKGSVEFGVETTVLALRELLRNE